MPVFDDGHMHVDLGRREVTLHDDSILQEPEEMLVGARAAKFPSCTSRKSRRRSSRDSFGPICGEKDSLGRVLNSPPDNAKRETEFLDDYIEPEARTIERLVSLESEPPKPIDVA